MKKLMIILCSIAVIFSLFSCGDSSGKSEGEGTSPSKGEIENLQIIDKGRLRCSSEKGYYYIGQALIELKEGSYGYLMMYMDFDTKKEICLCNRPGCNHDDESCPAVFKDDELSWGGSLFYYDDHLYLFSHDQDQAGSSVVKDPRDFSFTRESDTSFTASTAQIYRMNPDGTDRKKVFTFEEGLSVEDQVLASGNSLFFVTKKISTENIDNQTTYCTTTERNLVEVDMDGWKAHNVCKLSTESPILGALDNRLIIKEIVFDRELSNKEKVDEDKYFNAYKDSQSFFTTLNLETGKAEEIVKVSNDKTNTCAVSGKYLYLSTEGEDKIVRIDIESGEKKILAETKNSYITDVYKDVLHCSSWSADEDNAMYFVHLDDGKIEKSHLQLSSIGGPIYIWEELIDQFLVLYDYDAQKDPMYEGQYNINGAKYALINKADLYKGKDNYQNMKMISSGMVAGE